MSPSSGIKVRIPLFLKQHKKSAPLTAENLKNTINYETKIDWLMMNCYFTYKVIIEYFLKRVALERKIVKIGFLNIGDPNLVE